MLILRCRIVKIFIFRRVSWDTCAIVWLIRHSHGYANGTGLWQLVIVNFSVWSVMLLRVSVADKSRSDLKVFLFLLLVLDAWGWIDF